MALNRNALSTLVPGQLPEFVRSEYQTFIQFIQAYYDFMDASGVTIDMDTVRDIDESLDSFISHIKAEVAPKIPLDIANDRFHTSRLRDLYDAKGSASSYKLLFRLLYGKETDITYPSQQMLIPSDGRWTQPYSIFVKFSKNDGPIPDLVGQLITLNNQGLIIQTFVERVEPTIIYDVSGNLVVDPATYQLFISKNYFGTITTGATMSVSIGSAHYAGVAVPCSTKITVISGGQGFKIGEIYSITTATGVGALLKINDVDSNGAITNGELIGAGINYATTFSTSIFAKQYGQSGGTPAFTISYAAGTYTIGISDNTNPMIDSGTITLYDYTTDLTYWDNSYVGTPVGSFYDVGSTAVINTSLAATIQVTVGPVAKYPGYFATNSGFLSDALYIQDSNYYQQFSYVVKLDQTLDSYAGVLKSLLHPAGTNLFGEFFLQDTLSGAATVSDSITRTTW